MRLRSLKGPRRAVTLLAALAWMSIPTAAGAQTLYTGTPIPNVQTDPGIDNGVLGASGGRPQASLSAEVLGIKGQRSGSLALTGGDIGGLMIIGFGSVTAGLVMTRRSRRTASVQSA